MNKLFKLTQGGIDELKVELEALKIKRVGTAEAIKTARELGDLSENAEYQSARQEQERNDSRIDEIEHILNNTEVIKSNGGKHVDLGSKVTLKGGKRDIVLTVVGTIEANPLEQKISDESPIGKALIGRTEGEEVEIKTPTDTTVYKIASIS